jgi:DNA-directed RNA polymerase specialized sigma24 family protein
VQWTGFGPRRQATLETSRWACATLSESAADVTEVVELRIESERVSKALAKIPHVQREAIALAHLGGYTHSEVSKILHIPVAP